MLSSREGSPPSLPAVPRAALVTLLQCPTAAPHSGFGPAAHPGLALRSLLLCPRPSQVQGLFLPGWFFPLDGVHHIPVCPLQHIPTTCGANHFCHCISVSPSSTWRLCGNKTIICSFRAGRALRRARSRASFQVTFGSSGPCPSTI